MNILKLLFSKEHAFTSANRVKDKFLDPPIEEGQGCEVNSSLFKIKVLNSRSSRQCGGVVATGGGTRSLLLVKGSKGIEEGPETFDSRKHSSSLSCVCGSTKKERKKKLLLSSKRSAKGTSQRNKEED